MLRSGWSRLRCLRFVSSHTTGRSSIRAVYTSGAVVAARELLHNRREGALRAAHDWRINCFGHLGDGNLHYNLFPAKGRDRAEYDDRRAEGTRLIHDMVAEMGGSVSAEHGIGRLKVDDLERYGDPVKLALMRRIKEAFDPLGILNPGAVLREV